VNENELPKLPDGWEWTQFTSEITNDTVNVAFHTECYHEVYVEAGNLTISANHDIDYAPAEVVIAVLKANGVL
jgi:hypothetical protein